MTSLFKWGRRVYDGFMAKEIPPPIIKVLDILKILNNNATGEGDWVRVPGNFGMSVPAISPDTSLNFHTPTNGILFVTFVNQKTTEMKFYAAKWTDDPVREQLWP